MTAAKIAALVAVTILALTLSARVGIEEGRKVVPHSWLHQTHHVSCFTPKGYPSGAC